VLGVSSSNKENIYFLKEQIIGGQMNMKIGVHPDVLPRTPRKCGVEREVVWMSDLEQARNGHCAGGCVAEDPRKCSVECEVVW